MFLKHRYYIAPLLGILFGLQTPALGFASEEREHIYEAAQIDLTLMKQRFEKRAGLTSYSSVRPIQPTLFAGQEKVAVVKVPTPEKPATEDAPLVITWNGERIADPAKASVVDGQEQIELAHSQDAIIWNGERIEVAPDETATLATAQDDMDDIEAEEILLATLFDADVPEKEDAEPVEVATTQPAPAAPEEFVIVWNSERIEPVAENKPAPVKNKEEIVLAETPVAIERAAGTMPRIEQNLALAALLESGESVPEKEEPVSATTEEPVAEAKKPTPIAPGATEDIAEEERAPETQPSKKSVQKHTPRVKFVELASPDKDEVSEKDKISLTDAVVMALQSNPSIKRSFATKDLYEASLQEVRGQSGPQISGFTNVSGEYDSSDESSSRFDDSIFAKTGLRVNYALYNFGASGKRIEAGEKSVEQARLQIEEARESIAFDVISTYIEILRQRDLLDVEQFRIDEHRDYLSLIEEAANADHLLQSQLHLARTGLVQRQQSFLNVERQLKQAVYALDKMVGARLSTDHLKKPFTPIVVLPEEEEFIQMGLEASPEVSALKQAIDAARGQKSAANKDRFGNVNLNMNVTGDRNLTGEDRANEASGSVLLEYTVPLYTSGTNEARVKRADAALRQSMLDLSIAQDSLTEQLRMAYYAIQTNDEILSLSKQEEQNALKTLEAYKGEVAYGGRSFSDVLTQIDSVAGARGREISARTSKTLAAYAIMRRQGNLLNYMKVSDVAPDADTQAQ